MIVCMLVGLNITHIAEWLSIVLNGFDVHMLCSAVNACVLLFMLFVHFRFKKLLCNSHIVRLQKYGYLNLDIQLTRTVFVWICMFLMCMVIIIVVKCTSLEFSESLFMGFLSVHICVVFLGVLLFCYWLLEIIKLSHFAKD